MGPRYEIDVCGMYIAMSWMVFANLAKPLASSLAAIGIDLGLFKLLVNNPPLSVKDIAEKTGASPGLLRHLLRAMASFGLIKETGKDQYTKNHWVDLIADPNVEFGVNFM